MKKRALNASKSYKGESFTETTPLASEPIRGHSPARVGSGELVPALAAREALGLLRLLRGEFQVDLRLAPSRRAKKALACYDRPILIRWTPSSTEEDLLHEVAHALDIMRTASRPHSHSFAATLREVKKAWFGPSAPA